MNKRQAKIVAYEYIVHIIQGAIDAGCSVDEFSEANIVRIQAAMEKVAEEMQARVERLAAL